MGLSVAAWCRGLGSGFTPARLPTSARWPLCQVLAGTGFMFPAVVAQEHEGGSGSFRRVSEGNPPVPEDGGNRRP